MHSSAKRTKRQARASQANPIPFSPMPRKLLEDPKLTPIDKVIAGLIIPWLLKRPSGWVLNGVLADAAGVEARSVRRSLRRLEENLWFRVTDDPSNRSRRRITALWRTKDGLEAINERFARLANENKEDPTVPPRGTPVSSKEEALRKKNTRDQRFCFPQDSEPCVITNEVSHARPVNVNRDGDDDDVYEQKIREAVQLAGELSVLPRNANGKDNSRGIPLVRRYADLLQYLFMDDAENLGYFRDIGWWTHRKELTALDSDIEIRGIIKANEEGGVVNAGALFRSNMQKRRRVIDAVGVPVWYDLEPDEPVSLQVPDRHLGQSRRPA